MDLDLEQLLGLELNLNAMGVTSIHHTHAEGEWMLGYKWMSMKMRGNLNGTSDRSTADVLAQYMVAPTEMTMQMHMFGLMYAPTDEWTLMAMVPYIESSMDHVNGMGVRFTTKSSGLGDIKLSGLYSLWRYDGDERTVRLVARAGMSVPTGSLNPQDDTPMGVTTLPYPMRLGSGTYDLRPALTYMVQTDRWGYGSHVGSTFHLGSNRKDYRLGNELDGTAWIAGKFANWLSASLRVEGRLWGNIHGSDDRLNPTMVPTADPDLRAGRRIDLLFGINLFALSGVLNGHRLMLEGGVPVYQALDGPQLETRWRLSLGWNYTFTP